MYSYLVYGVVLDSELPLPLTNAAEPRAATVTLRAADRDWLAAAIAGVPVIEIEPSWYRIAHLPDGAIYVCWEEWFHFLVSSDGRVVHYGLLAPAPDESFHAYLLSQVLSFSLVKQGHEPLHVTSVAKGGVAVGFMGESGLGKSTLAACFLAAGWQLLTDDLLLVSPESGLAQPGPRRIKLYPEAARWLPGGTRAGAPMYPTSEKQIIALDAAQCADAPTPMRRLYALSYPEATDDSSSPRIEALTEQEALVQLLGSTFNTRIRTKARLRRQFECFGRLAQSIPVKRLVYSREMSRLGEVRDLILADVA
jgi:hypothetical protein